MSEPKQQRKAAGYIRVSSSKQATEGESLSTQKKAIEDYCQSRGLKLVKCYSDEGVSGKGVATRIGLRSLLRDAQSRVFDIVLVHRLSRFGRNARDLLNNVKILGDRGIEFVSPKESMDFSTPYGKAMLTMLGAIAELEREIISEQSNENKIARIRQGIPSVSSMIFGRDYDKKTGQWSLDEKKADLIRWAAKEYLNGRGFADIAEELTNRHGLKISTSHLWKVLAERCGPKWIINFKGQDPMEIDVPPILDDETITAIKERLEFNKTWNRKDASIIPR